MAVFVSHALHRHRTSSGWFASFVLAVAAGFADRAAAAEGMWTLDNLPKDAIAEQYGFTPDAKWIEHVMKSAVRLAGGCSGSFVSGDGLVLTNHHCINSCVQQLSSADRDYIENGFLAETRADELQCPEIELNRLERITDVSARMHAATDGRDGRAYSDAAKAEKATIEAECVGKDGATRRCDVVELYHGGRYALYRYDRFQDVRLAFAPELAAAFFGGDPDNFTFPRYALDMGLLRAYRNGKPAKTPEHFRFAPAGAKSGELTFMVGHPGSTQRQLTVAQLETVRDTLIQRLLLASELRGVLTQFGRESAEHSRIAQSDLFGVENSLKARKGMLKALQSPTVMDGKRAAEAELRAYVAAHPELAAKYGGAWDETASAQRVLREMLMPYRLYEQAMGFGSEYFVQARWLVRGAAERQLPNERRLREYTDSALPAITQKVASAAPIHPALEEVKLAWSLAKLREELGADDPRVKAVLGKESPEAVAERLVAGTGLGDAAVRKALWDGGAAAVAASTDPFIVLARAVDATSRALRARYEDEVEAVETKSAEKIAGALFAMKGTSVYPDATFSLRLTYGEVRGWQSGGRTVAPFTDYAGAYERHTGAAPYALPPSWLAAKARVDPRQPLDFVTTNDIIGGNSGSPVLNRDAEVVGLVFDGNIDSLGGAYYFDESVNRAVSVHAGAIVAALRGIYAAGTLADELVGK